MSENDDDFDGKLRPEICRDINELLRAYDAASSQTLTPEDVKSFAKNWKLRIKEDRDALMANLRQENKSQNESFRDRHKSVSPAREFNDKKIERLVTSFH